MVNKSHNLTVFFEVDKRYLWESSQISLGGKDTTLPDRTKEK